MITFRVFVLGGSGRQEYLCELPGWEGEAHGRCWQEVGRKNEDLTKLLCRRTGMSFTPEKEEERENTGRRTGRAKAAAGG